MLTITLFGNYIGCVCMLLSQPYMNQYFVRNCFGCLCTLSAQPYVEDYFVGN